MFLGSVRHKFVICINPTGTATSSPVDNTASQSDMNIVNVMLWMRKNAYADTTIKATGKRLRSLQRNCNLKDPENVKGYIANKKCTNGFKETMLQRIQTDLSRNLRHLHAI